ncbi:MAG: UxaA family hydrolase [Syntrophorhabdaceae bacterium]|nr:UxaA family hydrolase [Syntrophorhabdaceae bacterium]
MKKGKAVIIDERDNVATAVTTLEKGSVVSVNVGGKEEIITIKERIPGGHKFAIYDIDWGQPLIKYGEIMGLSKTSIKRGEHVHVHNVTSPSKR